MTPSTFAESYAKLKTRLRSGGTDAVVDTPVRQYLQAGRTTTYNNGQLAQATLFGLLATASGDVGIAGRQTFTFNGFVYISASIRRCFMGKATPWELQETLMLASQLGMVSSDDAVNWCRTNLGVDCGGLVAAYWGVGVPHLVQLSPWGATGILPRGFWDNGPAWADAHKRRRKSFESVAPGDAAIFFKDVIQDNPDVFKKRDADGKFIEGTGSEAFHIGLVESVGFSPKGLTELTVTESSGAASSWGADGVSDRKVSLSGSAVGAGGWVYALEGTNRIYFVQRPAWAGPETAYTWKAGDP